MNAFINYLIEANIGLCLFLLIYSVFLKKETDFRLTRTLLLSGMMASLLFPLFHLQLNGSSIPSIAQLIPSFLLPEIIIGGNGASSPSAITALTFTNAITSLYLTGIILFTIVFTVRLVKLIHLIASSITYAYGNFIVAESDESKLTFSFFHFIFIGRSSSLSPKEKQQILDHESIHATQWHSADILLLNVMSILFWINPFLLIYKKIFIQLHEFEADSRAVEKHEVDEYCGLLARAALLSADYPIANHFNQSLTLKRIAMMQTIKTKIKTWKVTLIIAAFPALFTLVACQEQLAEDLKIVEESAAVSLDLPADIQSKIVEMKKSGKDFVFIETTTEEGKKTVEKMNVNQISTLNVIKNRSDGRSFIIIERTGQNTSMSQRSSSDKVYTLVDDQPEYPGGLDELKNFISTHLQYPEIAAKMGTEGVTFVSFIVGDDGAISDVQIIKGVSNECDKEAARVIKTMPKWNPGKLKGQAVNVRFVLPIKFKLS